MKLSERLKVWALGWACRNDSSKTAEHHRGCYLCHYQESEESAACPWRDGGSAHPFLTSIQPPGRLRRHCKHLKRWNMETCCYYHYSCLWEAGDETLELKHCYCYIFFLPAKDSKHSRKLLFPSFLSLNFF